MFDPITLEVMRCKLEAIADDGAKTVIRTAISPAVADAGDCSCAIYAVNGDLIVGGGGDARGHDRPGRPVGLEAVDLDRDHVAAPGGQDDGLLGAGEYQVVLTDEGDSCR